MTTSTEKLVMALRVLATDIQSDDGAANAALFEASLRLEQLSEKIIRLREGLLGQNQNIEQTCGKVLGYPWFKDDQKNFFGATEKDGVCVGDHVAETIAAELARKYTEAKERIKRLEEALTWYESTVSDCNRHGPQGDAARHALAQDRGSKAKEAKL